MEGHRRALKAFTKDSSLFGALKTALNMCLRSEDDESKFMDQYVLKVEQAVSPELIKWSNLGVSTTARFFFNILNVLITLLILAFSTFLVVAFNQYKEQLSQGIGTYIADGQISEALALEDFVSETPIGVMSAYCSQQEDQGVDIASLKFSLDDRLICAELQQEQMITFLMTIAVSIVLASLNPVSCIVLQKLAALSRWKTLPEETFTAMFGTLVTQYINIALVLFLVNFKMNLEWLPEEVREFIEKIAFFNGSYEDFTVGWFKEVGPALCITMIMQVVIPQTRNAFPFLIFEIRRWVDRKLGRKHRPATR
mmetsp:Transcript_17451/g.26885  ORF Transcript_17451/g.26885 Transcript_17451/m.26885 type:complete len:311 (+) Transcript_17451:1931-2863(+)